MKLFKCNSKRNTNVVLHIIYDFILYKRGVNKVKTCKWSDSALWWWFLVIATFFFQQTLLQCQNSSPARASCLRGF